MKSRTYTPLQIILLIVVIAVIAIAIMHSYSKGPTQTLVPSTTTQTVLPINTVTYSCNAGKIITAAYYMGQSIPSTDPNMPPTPGGSVVLTLSDGRTMTLPQTISADGTRYANSDESFVFWGKGNGALVLENNQEKSFTGCILEAPDPTGALPQVYSNSQTGFSLRLPSLTTSDIADSYRVDPSYKYQGLGPGKDIYGTKFTIPVSLTTGTNLSPDSYISVEEIPKTAVCSASLFVDKGSAGPATTVTDNQTTYSMIKTGDAAAGNRYDETVYAIPGTNPCLAVRYFIHYGAYANYDSSKVKEFDEQALQASFDQIRRTLIINQ